MGVRGGGKISRYETFAREPSLRTALAFEVIYKRSVSELFDNYYREIEREIAERAKILNYRKDRNSKETAKRRRETLTALASISNKSIQ